MGRFSLDVNSQLTVFSCAIHALRYTKSQRQIIDKMVAAMLTKVDESAVFLIGIYLAGRTAIEHCPESANF